MSQPASTPDPADQVDPASLSFEEATTELESIITRIESGEIGLEDSLVAWRRGGTLLKRCREVLDHAEKELSAAELDDDGARAEP